jgi:ubiquinone/menaquinone biosynthesis C-methylase UbiE
MKRVALMFQDLFSGHADDYKLHRPTYPKALFDYLSSLVSDYQAVWDCGTGNGQAAAMLADYFETVYATDPSAKQIEVATKRANINYQVAAAEAVPLADQSVSVVTVFQAFHWFDAEAFYKEVRRVLKPEGILAIIGYHTAITGIDGIDALYRWFNHDFLWKKDCWAMARESLNADYCHAQLPGIRVKAPDFFSTCHWTMQDYIAYFNTWSAVKAYEKKYGENPVAQFVVPKLEKLWSHPDQVREVSFPLVIKIGRLES